ncbi:Gram-positive signal peptide protein, YSIRK family [Aeromicrobium marinum DSM 15272]|uniref:Gram-positive signal peptide protein, YSIRK family n=1 Tax=Aeromicrobium marinum DSM 15272 TaxID=585531 RepID=E2SF90_9ACTN|nr:alpha/beta fold hydrolase [Aeromicrobium marinum]EFQ82175.1 Gram-positive signal peptide protein, YSIRK family [Aeromicrobium marinum DSM 15272]
MKHHSSVRRLAVGVLAALTFSVAVAGPAAAVDPTPRPLLFGSFGGDNSFPAALATSIVRPAADPAGANDWSCRPSAQHPRPVVLVHGTLENAYNNWNGLSPIIEDQGYCVFALNFGNSTGIPFVNGTGDLVDNATEVGVFVDRVLAATGATQVDLIGHSQGGMISRYYTNVLGGADHVANVVGLASSNRPTNLFGITRLGSTLGLLAPVFLGLELLQLPALAQQVDPSPAPQTPFYQRLNGNGQTVPGVTYTNIATRKDEVVTPYTAAFIEAGPGATVHNITIQDVCLLDRSEHLSLSYSKNVAQIILNTLDPSDVHRVRCFAQLPLFGNTQLFG